MIKEFSLTCPQLLSSERAVRDNKTTDERCLFAQQIPSFRDSCGIEYDQASMKNFSAEAEAWTSQGKKSGAQTRKKGRLPCSTYEGLVDRQ